MTIEGLGGPRRGLSSGLYIKPRTTRRVFFSFHYERDIWRVQQVRNHWLTKPNREVAGYFDGSLSEKAKTEGKAVVKRLINAGMDGSSVTCILTGAETFRRYWVDYEIFRSVELGKGVFGVTIHGLKNKDGHTDKPGSNPFTYLGYVSGQDGKMVPYVNYTSGWKVYEDANAISPSAAKYLVLGTEPVLSSIFKVYDWVADDGYENFAAWVDAAARQVGR